MKKINFEYIEHEVKNQKITFVLDKDNQDWYFETVRKKPFLNPVHHHLSRIIDQHTGTGDLRYADFGANIGVTSFFAAALGVRTLAIEAGRINSALLNEAHQVNGFGRLYTAVQMAASAAAGTVRFSENSAWGRINNNPGATDVEVPADTMAAILTKNGFADARVIKVDIEGAELAALNGFEMIASRPSAPDLIVESNDSACTKNGYTSQDLWVRLMDLGYKVYLLEGLSLVSVTATTIQPSLVMDVLATKKTEAELEGHFSYKVIKRSKQEQLKILTDFAAKHSNKPGVKDFTKRQLKLP
jgi:FkbM family methyltransferase